MLESRRVATTYLVFFALLFEYPNPSFGFLVPLPSSALDVVVSSSSGQGIHQDSTPRYDRCCGISLFSVSTWRSTVSQLMARSPSKWDIIVDDDDDDVVGGILSSDTTQEVEGIASSSSPSIGGSVVVGSASIPVPVDMTYEPRNVQRQHEHFLAIRAAGGKEVTNDVYVRNPKEDVFWYGGKVARTSDVSLEDCIARQWHMIERHATNLRPLDLYPHRGILEIWTAPGDSELEVAYNRPTLQLKKMAPKVVTSKELKNNRIGFQGEMYQEGEEGFRTWRTEDGSPARPEINVGGETRPPNDEEYAQIQKELQGKDIQDIYEEQERRKEQGLL